MKPALGRSLGTLLGGPVSKPVPDPSVAQPQLPLQQPGPGVRSLLRGQHDQPAAPVLAPEQEASPLKVSETKSPLIPSWYFFAADLLLVVVALIFIFQCPPGSRWQLRLAAIGLVLLGGCLGLWGVWLGVEKEKKD